MLGLGGDSGDRQSLDRGEVHRAVAFEPAMLRRDFSRLVLKLPRRIREDRLEGLPAREFEKIFRS